MAYRKDFYLIIAFTGLFFEGREKTILRRQTLQPKLETGVWGILQSESPKQMIQWVHQQPTWLTSPSGTRKRSGKGQGKVTQDHSWSLVPEDIPHLGAKNPPFNSFSSTFTYFVRSPCQFLALDTDESRSWESSYTHVQIGTRCSWSHPTSSSATAGKMRRDQAGRRRKKRGMVIFSKSLRLQRGPLYLPQSLLIV